MHKNHILPTLLLQTRDLVRNTSYFIFVLLFPFFMSGTFLMMTELMKGKADSPNFGPQILPMAIFLAVTGTTLTVTAGPIAELRQSGALRMLSITPLSKSVFLATHLIIRFIMTIVQLILIFCAAIYFDLLATNNILSIFLVSILGTPMLFAVGYIIGGQVTSSQLATNLSTLIQLFALFSSGLALPFFLFPDSLVSILKWLPTTLYGDLMFWAIGSTNQEVNVLLNISIILIITLVLSFLAVWGFKWETEKS